MPTIFNTEASSKRVQCQRTAGFILLVAMAFCWYGILYPTSTVAKEWKAEFFPDAWKWVYVGTAYWVVVVLGLFTGKVWGWYVATTSLYVSAILAFQIAYPFIPSWINLICILPIGLFLLHSAPQWLTVNTRLHESVDALASSLNVRWEDQPLWQMVQAGKSTEVVHYLEAKQLSTIDAALLCEQLTDDPLELKLYILREQAPCFRGHCHDNVVNEIG